MTEFTKGPWIADSSEEDMPIQIKPTKVKFLGFSDQGLAIISCRSEPESIANAYLIAAAPELYEALKAILDTIDDEDGMLEYTEQFINARVALAKAIENKE